MKKYDASVLNGFLSNISSAESFGAPVEVRGIPDEDAPGSLDPRELPYAEAFAAAGKAGVCRDIAAIRRATGYVNYNINTAEIITDCIDIHSHGRSVRVWVYYPRKPFDAAGRPCFIYFHGGSFFAGTPFICENTCRYLAEKAGCVVFNADYSLAPELPYPSGYQDCVSVLDYVYDNAERFGADREKLCIGGDSAGGLLSAAVNVCDAKRRIKLAAYFYPCVTFEHMELPFEWRIGDFEMCPAQRSLIEPKLCLGRADGLGNDELMLMIKQLYLQHGEDITLPSISPIHGNLSGLGRSLIFTAEFDGLRYHGEYFAALLKKAGVSTRTVRYRGVFHAFMEKIGILPQAEDAVNIVADEIKKLFG